MESRRSPLQPSEKGKGKAKETANTTEDAEEEERKLVTQEREAEVSPEATEETVIEEEGGLLGETMGKSPPPEKKTVVGWPPSAFDDMIVAFSHWPRYSRPRANACGWQLRRSWQRRRAL